MTNDVQRIADRSRCLDAQGLLKLVLGRFGEKIALATSFAAEDQVLTDMVCRLSPRPHLFTIDTARLPQETYDAIEATRRRYAVCIQTYFPDRRDVEALVTEAGPNAFYHSLAARKQCCHVCKVLPLRRALAGLDAWITGMRREQAPTRRRVERVEWDAANGLIKINPLADWSTEEVWAYIRRRGVPYNRLHDAGYPSIGCAPCTRAVAGGEDLRAGRWWWERAEHKECGLHRHGASAAARREG